MRIEQRQWSSSAGWRSKAPSPAAREAQLVLVYGAREAVESPERLAELKRDYPAAELFGCSTAGEIMDAQAFDGTLTATAVRFDATRVAVVSADASQASDGRDVGARLAAALPTEGLTHVYVLFDGLVLRTSDILRGLSSALPPGVAITGGLAGDGSSYERTVVLAGGRARSGAFAALGFYGPRLRASWASLSGWDPFGPERVITRSKDNIVYELDGRPALELYKSYLGEKARGLPASALFYPLSLRAPGAEKSVIRSVQAVDAREGSVEFLDYMPEGYLVRLMKGNFNRVLDGAVSAARQCRDVLAAAPQLALVTSCVARKFLLTQRVEEELEGVRDVLGAAVPMAGFYAYGEIAPFARDVACELHNHTMTITTLAEV